MDLWDRLSGRNVVALEADLARARAEVEEWRGQAAAWFAEYEALVAAVRALQAEVEEATDGQVSFLPRAVVTETVLLREHNRKEFHAVA